jgi:pimeloyl-ACP methyl ester carboxylesterase
MLRRVFHAWERNLAAATPDRVVRPFEWGLEWIPRNGRPPRATPFEQLETYAAHALADSEAFYATPPINDFDFDEASGQLRYRSALDTGHVENDTVHARFFPADPASRWVKGRPRRAVLVLPHWNSPSDGHVGLCRLFALFGLDALRLSLPYHDERMPPELHRADYIVSSNLGRTLQVCRQAVLDARRAVDWLDRRGYQRIGIVGTSLGSCLSMLTAAHEPRIRAAALNHISPYFADVVWEGLSTAHVRQGLDGHIDLDRLRRVWMPISPQAHLPRMRNTPTLLVYASYDLTFPVHLSKDLVRSWQDLGLPHEVAVLPCGHYSTGFTPWKWMDGFILTRFLVKTLG